ncbi:LysR family transcriptional regulator [Streptomyces sp. NRRL F-5126]|uniref:LysR family transcriptional regulator n=1 Tax=Streptomyces sp. NRRL F-5126 TaxID=1463857 RepID=UPI001F16685B|nr:LysR family transcriptional regulator [Streptomyces sp. NRRL F-5126]
MDLIAACRVFVRVGEYGSVTLGASAARVPQSVASRRIAALEGHFGERLFDRSTRRVALTAFGRAMLPSAKRLVRLADAMEFHAEQVRLRPLAVAVPATCSVMRLAELDAAARREGAALDFKAAGPGERAELLRSLDVRVALLAVPPAEADWTVPLGVASAPGAVPAGHAASGQDGPLRLETLRPGRTRAARHLWLQPEDDVPHVRGRLEQLGHRAALLPAQIAVASSGAGAVAAVLCGRDDLLVCSQQQAREWDMEWRGIAGDPAARGYVASATAAHGPGAAAGSSDTARFTGALREQVAQALGAPRAPQPSPEGAPPRTGAAAQEHAAVPPGHAAVCAGRADGGRPDRPRPAEERRAHRGGGQA